jgi:hypothetical protein
VASTIPIGPAAHRALDDPFASADAPGRRRDDTAGEPRLPPPAVRRRLARAR